MIKLVIGIVGPIGAGKDTVADYLVDEYGFKKQSTSDEIRIELRNRGKLHFTRNDIQEMANELRQEYKDVGRDILTERSLERLKESGSENGVIVGVRLVDGIKHLRNELGSKFILWSIDVNQKLRFRRKLGSNRSDDSDLQEWDAFESKDNEELTAKFGGAQEVAKVIELADDEILNNRSLKDLFREVDGKLEELGIRKSLG